MMLSFDHMINSPLIVIVYWKLLQGILCKDNNIK